MSLQVSEEMINAFIDDELDQQDRLTIKRAMEEDNELRFRIEQLCKLKRTVKQSYLDLPVVETPLASTQRVMPGWQQNVAMIAIMAIGLLFGWLAHGQFGAPVSHALYAEALQLDGQVQQQSSKVIVHISSSEPGRLEYTLQQVSAIIDKYTRHQMDFQIEVVANASGIDLLREDVSPYTKQISNVMERYQNVTFIACNNAIDRLRQQGIEPRLIRHTRTGVTAVDQIVKRLQQGWVYLKV